MVGAMNFRSTGPGLILVGEVALLSQCLSALRHINGYRQTVRATCDGLVSHPGVVVILPLALYYSN